MQLDLCADLSGMSTRRAEFLAELDLRLPWGDLVALIEPHYLAPGTGRAPRPLEQMLRLLLVKEWWQASDARAVEMAADSAAVAAFIGLPFGSRAPGQETMRRFARLVEEHRLWCQLEKVIAFTLARGGAAIVPGSISEPTLKR